MSDRYLNCVLEHWGVKTHWEVKNIRCWRCWRLNGLRKKVHRRQLFLYSMTQEQSRTLFGSCTEFTKPREQRRTGKHFLRKGQIEIKTPNTEPPITGGAFMKRQTTVLQWHIHTAGTLKRFCYVDAPVETFLLFWLSTVLTSLHKRNRPVQPKKASVSVKTSHVYIL